MSDTTERTTPQWPIEPSVIGIVINDAGYLLPRSVADALENNTVAFIDFKDFIEMIVIDQVSRRSATD